jgi:hypothetical protein
MVQAHLDTLLFCSNLQCCKLLQVSEAEDPGSSPVRGGRFKTFTIVYNAAD